MSITRKLITIRSKSNHHWQLLDLTKNFLENSLAVMKIALKNPQLTANSDHADHGVANAHMLAILRA